MEILTNTKVKVLPWLFFDDKKVEIFVMICPNICVYSTIK